MIDISDGLSSELHHIAIESNVGIEIDVTRIPLLTATIEYAARFKEKATDWALQSGEEYELLFTMREKDSRAVKNIPDVTMIGHVIRQRGVWLRSDNKKREKLPITGYTHF